MREWLAANPDERKGAKGKIIKSNRTDNEPAKMATSKGVIQGTSGGEVPGRAAGLRALHPARQMPEEAADHPDPAGQLLLRQGIGNHAELQRPHERAIDSERGRALYGGRFATVEPVFANIRHNKGLDRFTLRGQKKVDTQWKLYCLVHNIEKLAHRVVAP